MSSLQILSEIISPQITVLTFIGQMDESNVDANAPEVYRVIESLPQKGVLILNFSGLEYMNSKSIGYTVDFFNKVTEKQGLFIIAESQPQIEDILKVVGVTKIITMLTSLTEAKQKALAFTGNAGPAQVSTQEQTESNSTSFIPSTTNETSTIAASAPIKIDIEAEKASVITQELKTSAVSQNVPQASSPSMIHIDASAPQVSTEPTVTIAPVTKNTSSFPVIPLAIAIAVIIVVLAFIL